MEEAAQDPPRGTQRSLRGCRVSAGQGRDSLAPTKDRGCASPGSPDRSPAPHCRCQSEVGAGLGRGFGEKPHRRLSARGLWKLRQYGRRDPWGSRRRAGGQGRCGRPSSSEATGQPPARRPRIPSGWGSGEHSGAPGKALAAQARRPLYGACGQVRAHQRDPNRPRGWGPGHMPPNGFAVKAGRPAWSGPGPSGPLSSQHQVSPRVSSPEHQLLQPRDRLKKKSHRPGKGLVQRPPLRSL